MNNNVSWLMVENVWQMKNDVTLQKIIERVVFFKSR